MKNSVSYEIVKYLESTNSWTFGGKIEDHIRGLMGAKASNASRRCRELVEDGKLEVQYVQVNGKGGRVVQYRSKKEGIIMNASNVHEVFSSVVEIMKGQLSLI